MEVARPGDAAMIRSEEEFHFERRWWPNQAVLVRKTIVTEERTLTAPVRREEITIEVTPLGRGPDSEPNPAPARHPEGSRGRVPDGR